MSMKNAPHDTTICLPVPRDQNGRPLTYEELVMAMRSVLHMPAGSVQVFELEPACNTVDAVDTVDTVVDGLHGYCAFNKSEWCMPKY